VVKSIASNVFDGWARVGNGEGVEILASSVTLVFVHSVLENLIADAEYNSICARIHYIEWIHILALGSPAKANPFLQHESQNVMTEGAVEELHDLEHPN
jgi:hypothetical protein